MLTRSRKWLIAPISLATVLLVTSVGYADFSDSLLGQPGEDGNNEEPQEPTKVEELSPSTNAESLPGTEPLYDQSVMVTQVEVEGNTHVSIDTIMATLDTKPGSLYSKKRLQKDLKKLYESGYFTENLRAIPVATKDGIRVKYVVEENPLVETLRFEGNTLIPSEELEPLFREQLGLPQNANLINKAVAQVEDLYQKKGYVLARVDDIQEPETGKVVLIINEGKISKISFEGNNKTRDFVLKRAMAQKTGEIYNENLVADDMKRIFSVQAFSDVRRVIKASADKPGQYDLVIEVDEKKTGTISLGGGYDTGIGAFGTVGYSDVNFRGRGENVSTAFTVGSGVLNSDRDTLRRRVLQFQANWFTPSLGDSLVSLGTSFFAREMGSFNIPLAIERRVGGEINLGKPVQSVPGLSYGTGIGAETIRVREGATATALSQFNIPAALRATNLQDGNYAYLSPIVAYDSRDNRIASNDGWFNTLGSKLALGLNNASYGTGTANFRRYLTITDDINVSLNAQGGTTLFGSLPYFDMFRLGGNYTIRGFQEGGVGVGQNYMLSSAEIRAKFPFLKRLIRQKSLYDVFTAALFADAGMVFDRPATDRLFNRPGYGISVGAGLRINLPAVGPLRIDYGIPLGGNKGGYVRHFNFGVGQKF